MKSILAEVGAEEHELSDAVPEIPTEPIYAQVNKRPREFSRKSGDRC